VFSTGKDVLLDAYFGDSGSRGQMTRFGARTVSMRERLLLLALQARSQGLAQSVIFEFDDAKAKSVDIANENGKFSCQDGDKWTEIPAGKGGAMKEIERFEESKVKIFCVPTRPSTRTTRRGKSSAKSARATGCHLEHTLDDGARRSS